MFSPILLLFIYILLTPLLNKKTGNELYMEIILKKEFHGVLDNIYRDNNNHNTLTVCSNKNCYTIPVKWEAYFEVGDSISKDKNSFLLKHYSKSKKLKILNYKDLK